MVIILGLRPSITFIYGASGPFFCAVFSYGPAAHNRVQILIQGYIQYFTSNIKSQGPLAWGAQGPVLSLCSILILNYIKLLLASILDFILNLNLHFTSYYSTRSAFQFYYSTSKYESTAYITLLCAPNSRKTTTLRADYPQLLGILH